MTILILTRHGHVEGIKPVRFRGRADIPLSERGEAEAAAVAETIAAGWHPSIVYTSPLGRAKATGARIAEASGCDTAVADGLADIDYGDWQWKPHEEAEAEAPDLYALWRNAPQRVRFPNGEALQDLMVRAADFTRLLNARHSDETVVAVGHDSVNRVLLSHLLELPLSGYWRIVQEPCNLTVLEITSDGARLLRLNDSTHLAGLASG